MLEVDSVTITYGGSHGAAVDDVTLSVAPGERVGIVGESGSGKTTLIGSVLRALPFTARVHGDIEFSGKDTLSMAAAQFRKLRSAQIAHIPQDPLGSLNPVLRVGHQMRDVLRAHRRISKKGCLPLIDAALSEVGIARPEVFRRSYPHELSGGMRQRVLIAMSLINEPSLLIADEPTTALDVTVQAQIIELLHRELRSRDMAMLLITHDIGVVAEICERIVVMRHGQVIEEGSVSELFHRARHPYTQGLIEAAHMRRGESEAA